MISVFDGVNPKPFAAYRIGEVVGLIRESPDLAARTARARRILANEGEDAYRAFKRRRADGLIGVTWAGAFSYRRADGLERASGLVFAEADGVDSPDAERARLAGFPFTAAAYVSASGEGVHAAIRVSPKPDGAAAYSAAWGAAVRAVGLIDGGDSSVKDVSRLAFLAGDPDIYANPAAAALSWTWDEDDVQIGREGGEGRGRRGEGDYLPQRADGAAWIPDALAALSPDMDYHGWLQVGMAIHAGELAGEVWNGLALWDGWSARGRKYRGEGDTAAKWRSFRRTGITLGTLWNMATAAGWLPQRHSAGAARAVSPGVERGGAAAGYGRPLGAALAEADAIIERHRRRNDSPPDAPARARRLDGGASADSMPCPICQRRGFAKDRFGQCANAMDCFAAYQRGENGG